MKTRLNAFWTVCLLGWVLLIVAGPATAQAQVKKLTISEPGRLFLYIPLYFAIDKGYFLKEGLEVSMLTAGRRDLAMKAVMAGETFASVHDPVETLLARSRGAAVKIIAAVVISTPHWLVADKDITADQRTWRGKTVALATPPNTQHSFFIKELREGGWVEVDPTTYKLKGDDDPSQYLRIVYGAFGTDLPVLMAGRANMSLMLEPSISTAVLKGGKHIIKDYPSLVGQFLFSTINVSEDTIQKDRATVQRFVSALTRAYRDAHANPSELADVAVKWFPKAEPDVVIAATRNMIVAGSFTTNALFSWASLQKNLEYLAISQPVHPALKVKWEEIADISFAERAVKELIK